MPPWVSSVGSSRAFQDACLLATCPHDCLRGEPRCHQCGHLWGLQGERPFSLGGAVRLAWSLRRKQKIPGGETLGFTGCVARVGKSAS